MAGVEDGQRQRELNHLVVDGPWTHVHAAEYKARSVTSLGVGAGQDLAFLADLPGLRALSVVGACNGQDHSPVEHCRELESLTLATDATSRLDLRGLPDLTTLHTERGRVRTEHIAELSRLRHLRWTNYPDADMSAIAASHTLVTVQLDGVRRLRRMLPAGVANAGIVRLDLAYGRGQVAAEGLPRFEAVTSLSLHAVRLDDLAVIGQLRGLRELGLVSCGAVQDVEWLRGMPYLEHVALQDTPVMSCDLSTLDDLPAVRTRYVQPRTGYNRVYDDTVRLGDGNDFQE